MRPLLLLHLIRMFGFALLPCADLAAVAVGEQIMKLSTLTFQCGVFPSAVLQLRSA